MPIRLVKKKRRRGERFDAQWPNPLTAAVWDRIISRRANWLRMQTEAEKTYRRSTRDERMPGIWPKYTGRVEVAMTLFSDLERKYGAAFRGILASFPECTLEDVDCYAIAERLLTDDLTARIDTRLRQRIQK